MKYEDIKFFSERCEEHPDHQTGMVSHQMIQDRLSEEVDELRAYIESQLAQPDQEYHRGDRLICLETEEYCVIHISGTDRQWVKFPDSHIGVYTNEQVAELFELLPKELEQKPVVGCAECGVNGNHALYCVACAEKYLEDKNTKGQK